MKSEKVLVVPARCLWDRVAYTEKGLITGGADQLAAVVASCGVFMDRAAAEADPSHKQIIPYALVRYSDSFFLLQRKSAQGEVRLHHKFSVGVGGHINPSETALGSAVIEEGLAREVNEELYIEAGYQERQAGLINDDTTDVGRVHLGVLFEVNSTSLDVRVRETEKMHGDWAPIERLKENYERLETWSQIVYDSYLCSRRLWAYATPQPNGL
jgi:predicted NUDIX family phosphoesterase